MDQIDQDLQCVTRKGNQKDGAAGFSGFHTASGKKVDISEEALKRARTTMDQIDQDLQCVTRRGNQKDAGASFTGFQTASGKKVDISEEALKKARTTMDQIDQDLCVSHENGDASLSGFHTAKGKKGEVSAEAVEKFANNLQGHPRNVAEIRVTHDSFGGFQTASGRPVEVSEAALTKARATMAEIDRALGEAGPSDKIKRDFTSPLTEAGSSETSLPKTSQTKEASSELHPIPQVTPNSVVAHSISDDAMSREILESSKALLADDSFQELSELPPKKKWNTSMRCAGVTTPETEETNRAVHGRLHTQELRTGV